MNGTHISDNAQTPTSEVFDLGELQYVDRSLKRLPLAVVLAVIIGLGLELVLLSQSALPSLERYGLTTVSNLEFVALALAIFLVGILFPALGIPRLLQGAIRIQVDSHGVHLLFRRRSTIHYLWNDPLCTFSLYDYRAHPSRVRDKTAFSLYGAHIWNRRSLLTEPAFDTTLAAIKSQGLKITREVGSASWYGKSPIIYRIRGRDRDTHALNAKSRSTAQMRATGSR
jgi:hypothetical protein